MRLATWNVNSVTARLPRLLDWLAATAPDVVCLQETKTAEFPVEEVGKLGYDTAAHGDGRWNGVAVLSRVGLADVRHGLAGEPGNPSPEELAVLTAVMTAAGSGNEAPAPPQRGRWNDPSMLVRRPLVAGPGAWQAAVR